MIIIIIIIIIIMIMVMIIPCIALFRVISLLIKISIEIPSHAMYAFLRFVAITFNVPNYIVYVYDYDYYNDNDDDNNNNDDDNVTF